MRRVAADNDRVPAWSGAVRLLAGVGLKGVLDEEQSVVIRRVVMAGAFAAAPLVGLAVSGGVAHADSPTDSVVEASQDFCVDADQGCTQPGQLGNLGYEEVAAVNSNGQAVATPSHIVFVCARGYTARDGTVHTVSGHAFVGPTAEHFDGGTPRGVMAILGNATEASTRAVSFVDVSGNDPVMKTHASAVGRQVTDNVTDAPIRSDIDVTISGQLTDQTAPTGPNPPPPPRTFRGTINCDVHATAAVTGAPPLGQPPDSEAVISDSDSD